MATEHCVATGHNVHPDTSQYTRIKLDKIDVKYCNLSRVDFKIVVEANAVASGFRVGMITAGYETLGYSKTNVEKMNLR